MRSLAPAIAGLLLTLALGACGASLHSSPSVLSSVVTATASSSGPVGVSPQSGTVDASPYTQVSFLGPRGTRVALDDASPGRAAACTPASCARTRRAPARASCPSRRFTEGERVSVSAQVSTGAGARTSPRPSRSRTRPRSARRPSRSTRANRTRSSTIRHAPSLTPVDGAHHDRPQHRERAPGDLFLAPYQGVGTPGTMITDQAGHLIWFHRRPGGRRRDELLDPDYDGHPRPDVVAGEDPRGRLRPGRRRHVQQLLPADRVHTGGQRLPRRPARAAHHAGRHRVDRRVRPDRYEPHVLRRRPERRPHRRRCRRRSTSGRAW